MQQLQLHEKKTWRFSLSSACFTETHLALVPSSHKEKARNKEEGQGRRNAATTIVVAGWFLTLLGFFVLFGLL